MIYALKNTRGTAEVFADVDSQFIYNFQTKEFIYFEKGKRKVVKDVGSYKQIGTEKDVEFYFKQEEVKRLEKIYNTLDRISQDLFSYDENLTREIERIMDRVQDFINED